MKLYSNQEIDFSNFGQRFSTHRSFKKAIELSASSYSHQVVRGTNDYKWDNIAPEIARVIIEDAKTKNIDIKADIEAKQGKQNVQDKVLNEVLGVISGNKNYALFSQILAHTISNGQSSTLSLDLLKASGIHSSEEFIPIYTKVLLEQKALTRNYPKFEKISDATDFNEVVEYLTTNPLFEKFLKDFTARLAYSYGRLMATSISPPSDFDRKSILQFLNKIGINNTEELKRKGREFIDEFNHDLFFAYLPAFDLIQDEQNKFLLYQWIADGNLQNFKDMISQDALSRLHQKIDTMANTYLVDEVEGTDLYNVSFQRESVQKFNQAVDDIKNIMRQITTLVASLEDNKNQEDGRIDQFIDELDKHLAVVKNFFTENHYASGTFEKFARNMLFNSENDKLVRYILDPKVDPKDATLLRIDVNQLAKNIHGHSFQGKPVGANLPINILDPQDKVIPPAVILRNILKDRITEDLKTDTHHYLTHRSYQNDQLPVERAPLVYRGMAISNDLKPTTEFVKKMTRHGDLPPDPHLLVGQENNINKHQVRSGVAATLIAATGVDGTRSTTDNVAVALRFGESKDTRVLYVVRGKQAFHSQHYLEERGKNKLSEIGYTHVKPEEYVMSIIYDKNNSILDVIPGNLTDEIGNVDAVGAEILTAAVNFYNDKHDPRFAKAYGKMPTISDAIVLPTEPLQEKRPLIDIMRAHHEQKKKTVAPSQLSSFRINKDINERGVKSLSLIKLSSQLELDTGELTLDDQLEDTPWPQASSEQVAAINTKFAAEYNLRHVITLRAFKDYSSQELEVQLKFNRILQPGFMTGNIEDQLYLAKIAGESWLTDCLSPTVEAAFVLNIAARLFVDYKVDIEQVNAMTEKLYETMFADNKNSYQIQKIADSLYEQLYSEQAIQSLDAAANQTVTKRFPDLQPSSPDYALKLQACREMAINQQRKALTNQLVSTFLEENLKGYAEDLGLVEKPMRKPDENADLVFLGAASSGKSTISKRFFASNARENYVSLATDDYRGITLPDTEGFEAIETPQVFIRTQDSAFLVKERIQARLAEKNNRPDLVIDCVTLEYWHRGLLRDNSQTKIVVACLDDLDLAITRSYSRAVDVKASTGDKGRFVNPTAMIEGHKRGSAFLFKNIPANYTVELCNTNVPYGSPPTLLGVVDSSLGVKTLSITDSDNAVSILGTFFDKSRANVKATGKEELFFKKLSDIRYQVNSLFLVLDEGYSINLQDQQQNPYLMITKNNGVVSLDILDLEKLNQKISNSSDKEAEALKSMVLLAHFGGDMKTFNKYLLINKGDMDSILSKVMAEITESKQKISSTINPSPT